MSKGGSSETTSTQPPKFARPFLKKGLKGALGLYQDGPSPDIAAGNDIARTRALGGSAPINAATDYVTKSLNGGFLNGNPFLDQTFNRAAMATQGQLASQFAGSGRNVDQSMGLRSQQLNDLASQIYGGAYDAERNRQQGVLGFAQPLGNQAYTDAGVLSGLQDPRAKALDDYLRRLGMISTGSTSKTSQSGGGLGDIIGGGLGLFGAFGG